MPFKITVNFCPHPLWLAPNFVCSLATSPTFPCPLARAELYTKLVYAWGYANSREPWWVHVSHDPASPLMCPLCFLNHDGIKTWASTYFEIMSPPCPLSDQTWWFVWWNMCQYDSYMFWICHVIIWPNNSLYKLLFFCRISWVVALFPRRQYPLVC